MDCADSGCVTDPSCDSPCATGPQVCKVPGVTRFTLRNASDDRRDKMTFSWTFGDATTGAEFGDPTDDTQYMVCVWDYVAGVPQLVMTMVAPPAGNCAGRPCWRSSGNDEGFTYRDLGLIPDGLKQVTLRSGPLGESRVVIKGRGLELPDPVMPFAQDPQITVQLVNSLGNCWGADYVSPAQVNTGTRLKAKEKP